MKPQQISADLLLESQHISAYASFVKVIFKDATMALLKKIPQITDSNFHRETLAMAYPVQWLHAPGAQATWKSILFPKKDREKQQMTSNPRFHIVTRLRGGVVEFNLSDMLGWLGYADCVSKNLVLPGLASSNGPSSDASNSTTTSSTTTCTPASSTDAEACATTTAVGTATNTTNGSCIRRAPVHTEEILYFWIFESFLVKVEVFDLPK